MYNESSWLLVYKWGAVAQWLERVTDNRVVAGSNPAEAIWKLAISFTPLCQCLSEETLKAVGPFYLVSMPGEVKDPTSLHWKCVTCRGLHHPLIYPVYTTNRRRAGLVNAHQLVRFRQLFAFTLQQRVQD